MTVTSSSPPPQPLSYIPSLDGMRAVAVILVFLSHIHFTKLIPGGFGVTIFFFLSGYLITTLLAREFDKNGRIAFKAFYIRRLLRLSPPLLITLAITFALYFAGYLSGVFDPWVAFSQIFYFYNYFALYGGPSPYVPNFEDGTLMPHTIAGLGLLWSLAVEEHFYMIWPLMFAAFARHRLRFSHIIGLIVAILIWRAIRVFVFGDVEWTIHTSTDTRFDMLLFGCLLALLNWRGHTARLFPGGFAKYVVIGVAVAAILATLVIRDETFRLTLRYTVQGIALMPLFYYAVTYYKAPIFQPLNWAPVRKIGVYSYSIYLSHFVIMQGLIYNGIAEDGSLKLGIVSAVITLVYSALMYVAVDKPCHLLRQRIASAPSVKAAG